MTGSDSVESATRPLVLVLYFVGPYAWTWSFNLLKILSQRDMAPVPVPLIVLDMTAGLGPLVSACVVSSYEAGPAGRAALLSQLLRWRAGKGWYVGSLLGPVALAVAAFGLWVVSGGSLPPNEALAQWTLLPAFFLYILIFGGGVGKELGWRGYALPRLQEQYGALLASVILGLLWAGWHLPAWFTPGSGQDAISFPVFVASTTGAAIVLTWLYNSTGSSLPLVILAHTMFNLCTTGPWFRALFDLPPDQRGIDPFNLLTVLVTMLAVTVVFMTDSRTLTYGAGRRTVIQDHE